MGTSRICCRRRESVFLQQAELPFPELFPIASGHLNAKFELRPVSAVPDGNFYRKFEPHLFQSPIIDFGMLPCKSRCHAHRIFFAEFHRKLWNGFRRPATERAQYRQAGLRWRTSTHRFSLGKRMSPRASLPEFHCRPSASRHGPDVGYPSKDIAGDLAFLGYVSLVLVENGVNSYLYSVIGFGTAANGLWTRNQPKLNETLICRLWRECVSPTMPDGCSDTSPTYEFAKINQNL